MVIDYKDKRPGPRAEGSGRTSGAHMSQAERTETSGGAPMHFTGHDDSPPRGEGQTRSPNVLRPGLGDTWTAG